MCLFTRLISSSNAEAIESNFAIIEGPIVFERPSKGPSAPLNFPALLPLGSYSVTDELPREKKLCHKPNTIIRTFAVRNPHFANLPGRKTVSSTRVIY